MQNEARQPCDYRSKGCSQQGVEINGRWYCFNHLPEERGHDGSTSDERIRQLSIPPESDWYNHQIAIVNRRNSELEAKLKEFKNLAEEIFFDHGLNDLIATVGEKPEWWNRLHDVVSLP